MTGYRTARRLPGTGSNYSAGGFGFLGLALAVSAQQKDLGVFHEPVGDGAVEENVALPRQKVAVLPGSPEKPDRVSLPFRSVLPKLAARA